MSAFPALSPNQISLSHGLPQVSEYTAFGIGPVRFKHNGFVNAQTFEITYRGLDQTTIQQIRDHYNHNDGTAGSFEVPSSVFNGLNVTNSSSKYRYAQTPTEVHAGLKRYDITVSLIAIEGQLIKFILDGGSATLAAESAFDEFVFSGTAPFILNGTTAASATLVLNAAKD
tara:strand:- start:373 stop:885 length:513 start_codon:yes stop_codon:yes gene_type:complete